MNPWLLLAIAGAAAFALWSAEQQRKQRTFTRPTGAALPEFEQPDWVREQLTAPLSSSELTSFAKAVRDEPVFRIDPIEYQQPELITGPGGEQYPPRKIGETLAEWRKRAGMTPGIIN